MHVSSVQGSLDETQRSEKLFQGELLVFQQQEACKPLLDIARHIIDQCFAVSDPELAHLSLSPEQYLDRAAATQDGFKQSTEVKEAINHLLQGCGVNPEDNYIDSRVLRIVPCLDAFDKGNNATLRHHRDTWGANIYCQQNWWLPIFKLESGRSMAFYPDYWRKPIANTTDSWSYSDFLQTRKSTPLGTKVPYPSSPQATDTVDESNRFCPVIEPGEILCFSSAHLHASRINRTGKIRFSVEWRTINQNDILENRSAPNIDNAASTPMYQWFKRISDGETLRI
ncbi:hypothetical protein K6Q96_22790 [Grimontia kaedaensis]|uniref:Phytanoyl-CoA dioxygenase n=1 Tax=Grimontia kaedaensis TaxID=2872157 RepID=A0ABY4WZX5_9GAMM|nr:hypothetical protein [Grimontia kaedaensis]USH04553.1 hypothetical protein K6Q96_22790 [Grimontia kaedaensis]